jgi:hypothetical protein
MKTNELKTLIKEAVREVLKEELAGVISQEIDFPKGVLATVMGVKIYSDLSWAEIFVSVIPEKESEPPALVLIVVGSGPVDRDGNGAGIDLNVYNKIAHDLYKKGAKINNKRNCNFSI